MLYAVSALPTMMTFRLSPGSFLAIKREGKHIIGGPGAVSEESLGKPIQKLVRTSTSVLANQVVLSGVTVCSGMGSAFLPPNFTSSLNV